MQKQLYTALRDRIAALTDGGAPLVRYVNREMGQFEATDHTGMRLVHVAWPAVLIDINNTQFTQLLKNVQLAECSITIRIGFTPLSQTSANAPDEYADKALKYYDIEDAINQALQGFCPANQPGYQTTLKTCGKLIRIEAATQNHTDTLVIRVITYKLTYEDYATETTQTTIPTPSPIFN
jgi:hypothetical protein